MGKTVLIQDIPQINEIIKLRKKYDKKFALCIILCYIFY